MLIAFIEIVTILLAQFWINKVGASSGIVISSFQTGSQNNTSAEFVKLSNTTSGTVSIDGWKLRYASAAGSVFTTKSTLIGAIMADSTVLVSTVAFNSSDSNHQIMSDGLAQVGGQLQIVDGSGTVVDLVAWGTSSHAEVSPLPAPSPGQIAERIKDASGVYIDTDNNLKDFTIIETLVATPTPVATLSIINQGLSTIVITELMPNPASPQTDDKDEYIEVYNPNDSEFVLAGYKLQTGIKFAYSLTLTTQVIPPRSYLVFKSSESTLALSNTEGIARLLDVSGNVANQTDAYGAAPEGQSWAFIDGSWQWTATITPGADNILSGSAISSASKVGTPKIVAGKAKTGSSVKSVSTSKSAKTSATNSVQSSIFKTGKDNPVASLHTAILAGVGGLAVLYGVYEYRQDIKNALYRFKRYRELRHANRPETTGR